VKEKAREPSLGMTGSVKDGCTGKPDGSAGTPARRTSMHIDTSMHVDEDQ
jgi:hypothetical protein